MIISRIYGALLRHPKFRRVDSVPDFIQDSTNLKRPVAIIRYQVYTILRELILDFYVYKSGLGRYYIRVVRVAENEDYVMGYVFRLSRSELLDFFNTIFAHLAELYPEEYHMFLQHLKAAMAGARICSKIQLYDSDAVREELTICVI